MKQSDFHVSVNGKQRRLRRVFLFEKMIILSKEERGIEGGELKYKTKGVVGLHEIGLSPYTSDEPTKCHIWTQEQVNYTLWSATPEQADTWTRALSSILWGQLSKIKRDRDMSRIRKTAARSRGFSKPAKRR